jgi:hypothetical protein
MARAGFRLLALFALLLVAGGCARRGEPDAGVAEFQEIPSPAGLGSRTPRFAAAPDGTLGMSWLEERADGGHALLWATLSGDAWSEPRTIVAGDSLFVNWADFPGVLAMGDGALAAQWLVKNAGDPHAYDVRLAVSRDGGRTWSPPVAPHRDGTAAEHGFVSLLPDGAGAAVFWLDGREYAKRKPGDPAARMALRHAILGGSGVAGEESVLDDRVCDCCPTAAVSTPAGMLVAYRDRSGEEIRDISLVRRSAAGTWGAPETPLPDGWRLAGCPVNGPALDARGESAALAWYTEAADTPRVYCALSADGGSRFGQKLQVDDGAPAGRVDVACLDDGSALVTWLEKTDQGAEVSLRRVSADGPGPRLVVAPTSPARKSGFPRLARAGKGVYVAWTDVSDSTRVRVSRTPKWALGGASD